MNVPQIREGLTAWAQAVTGLPMVLFQNDPQPSYDPQLVFLNVRGSAKVGIEDVFSEYDAGDKTLTDTVSGSREIFVTFQVDSFDHTPGQDAFALIERARTRMALDSNAEILHAYGLALATVSDPVDASYEADDSVVSRYSMDVVLNAVSNETGEPVPTIETVELSGEITDVDGTVSEVE